MKPRRRSRLRVAIAGGDGTAMFAAAADRVDWKLVAVAGEDTDAIADAMRARHIDLDELIGRSNADVVIVGTPPSRRLDDARALLARNVHVVLVPPTVGAGDVAAIAQSIAGSRAQLIVGDPLPMSPVVQLWLNQLTDAGPLDHVSGVATTEHRWSLLATTVLSARVAGWGEPVGLSGGELHFAGGRSAGVAAADHSRSTTTPPPRFELQAAGPMLAVRLELFPIPTLERNGAPLPLPSARHPADAFGVSNLLTSFRADIEAGRAPALGVEHLVSIGDLLDGDVTQFGPTT